jgi:hypothetical protein
MTSREDQTQRAKQVGWVGGCLVVLDSADRGRAEDASWRPPLWEATGPTLSLDGQPKSNMSGGRVGALAQGGGFPPAAIRRRPVLSRQDRRSFEEIPWPTWADTRQLAGGWSTTVDVRHSLMVECLKKDGEPRGPRL